LTPIPVSENRYCPFKLALLNFPEPPPPALLLLDPHPVANRRTAIATNTTAARAAHFALPENGLMIRTPDARKMP
jgi:hypothetical protein